MKVAIKDLKPGNQVSAERGLATITDVEPFPIVEHAGEGPAFLVTWTVDGEPGHCIASGGDLVELIGGEP